MITLTHLQFRRAKRILNFKTSYTALWAPISNYIVLIFIALILFIMWKEGLMGAVIMIPIWITFMLVLFDRLNPKDLSDVKVEND